MLSSSKMALFVVELMIHLSTNSSIMRHFVFIVILLFITMAFAPDGRKIPSVQVKTLDQIPFNTGDLKNDGNPMIISFWATWCSPCKRELNAIAENYIDWQDETGVKLVAVSIDDARNIQKVKPYVDGQAWEYLVLLDENADFKRAMNVNNVPHTFLVDGEGNIVWQHNSYQPGDEDELYELVVKLSKGESINEK